MHRFRTIALMLVPVLLGGLLALAATALPAVGSASVPVPGAPPGVHFSGRTGLVRIIHVPVRTHLPRSVRETGRTRSITEISSRNWAGYADLACGSCRLRFADVSFAAPAVSCKGVTTDGQVFAAFWAGLDGFTSPTVEQAGVDAYCDFTTPVYFGWFEMFPLPPVQFSIAGFGAGDAVNASVYFNGSGYDIAFNDWTQGVSATTVQPCPAGQSCQNTSAEVIAEAPFDTVTDTYTPLADFGQAFFSNATVTSRNGTHGNLGDEPLWSAYALAMANGADTLATPGGLINGVTSVPVSDFAVTWHAAD